MAGKVLSGIGAALQQFGTDWRRNQSIDAEDKREAERLRMAIEKDKFDRDHALRRFEQEQLQDERQLLGDQLPFIKNADEELFQQYKKAGYGGAFSLDKDISEQNVPQEFLLEGTSIQQQKPSYTRNRTLGEEVDQFKLDSGQDELKKRNAALAKLNSPEIWKLPAEQRAVFGKIAGVGELPETFEEWKRKQDVEAANDRRTASIYADSRKPVGSTAAGQFDDLLARKIAVNAPLLKSYADNGDIDSYNALAARLQEEARAESGFRPVGQVTADPAKDFQSDLQDIESDWKQALQRSKGNAIAARKLILEAALKRSWGQDPQLQSQYLQRLQGLN